MGLLTKSRQLGIAVKNIGRFREIVAVLTRLGFTDILVRMRFERFLPGKFQRMLEAQAEIPTEQRLRIAFEELGPTFVKLGQLLASRPDLVPEAFVDEFKKLQDQASTLPYSEIEKILEQEFKRPLSEIFESIDPTAIAAASIAQVHGAVLKTGEKVVLKVQRPGIEQRIDQDLMLLDFAAQALEKYVPETRLLSPIVVVDEFFRSLKQELDFFVEANNLTRFSEMMASFEKIKVPKVYRSLSTLRVLTMERLEGIPLKDVEAIRKSGADLKAINEIGARAFFKSIMQEGFFHGDLHGGNLFLLHTGELGLIDFGQMGRISKRARRQLSEMVIALIQEDFETLCYLYVDLGATSPSVDMDGFQREIRNSLAPYMGLRANELNSGQILIESTKIAARYQIRVPAEWMLVFKAIFTAEGMGRSLDPEFDVMSLGRELAHELVKDQFSIEKFTGEWGVVSRDLMSLVQVLPRQLKGFFRKFNQDGYVFEWKSPQLDEFNKNFERHSIRQSRSIISAGFAIAGSIALLHSDAHQFWQYPAISVCLFALGFVSWWRT